MVEAGHMVKFMLKGTLASGKVFKKMGMRVRIEHDSGMTWVELKDVIGGFGPPTEVVEPMVAEHRGEKAEPIQISELPSEVRPRRVPSNAGHVASSDGSLEALAYGSCGHERLHADEVAFEPPPPWLPQSNLGQREVDPLCWALTLEQWIFFVGQCSGSRTWRFLVGEKGENNIDMHDINTHFVIPWTKGTGSSVALLMNPIPQKAEMIISHARSGSAVESYNALLDLVLCNAIPSSTYTFYCIFCMYQAEDDFPLGLRMAEQLALTPFARVIESRPQYGMWVIHTSAQEVYLRTWTLYEIDEVLRVESAILTTLCEVAAIPQYDSSLITIAPGVGGTPKHLL